MDVTRGSVCLSPSSSQSGCHFPACPQRGSRSACLVCHFIYPSVSCLCVHTCGCKSRCDGFWASLGFDHDLLLKPCGRSSRSQTSPTTDNLTLLLSVCSSASSGFQNTWMFTVKWDRKQTVCLSHACTQKCTPPSLKTFWCPSLAMLL